MKVGDLNLLRSSMRTCKMFARFCLIFLKVYLQSEQVYHASPPIWWYGTLLHHWWAGVQTWSLSLVGASGRMAALMDSRLLSLPIHLHHRRRFRWTNRNMKPKSRWLEQVLLGTPLSANCLTGWSPTWWQDSHVLCHHGHRGHDGDMTLLSIVIAAFHDDAKGRHTTAHQPCLVRFPVPLEESVPVLFFEDTLVNVKLKSQGLILRKSFFSFHFHFSFFHWKILYFRCYFLCVHVGIQICHCCLNERQPKVLVSQT